MSGKQKILVVDDEEIIRISSEKILAPEGYDISLAPGGAEALEALEKEGFDLVLTDLKMPGMDGMELLRKIKEQKPDTEVVVITGFGSIKSAVEALRLGAYDYVEKPFEPPLLIDVVSKSLEHKRLAEENVRLRKEARVLYCMQKIVGHSKAMQDLFGLVATVAPTGATVLITGESGTGKELIAHAIHHNSLRKEGPFMVVDCGAIPDTLMESELFGHIKGSFTGAHESRDGLLMLADGGTIFLDEIGNMGIALQVKLLRFLQEREFRPIGGRNTIKVDVRVITAANRDLKEMVDEGTFREDLFYRLNVFPLHIAPLRERKDDVSALAYHFLAKYSDELGREVSTISAGAMKKLLAYDWPGNVRELENVINRTVVVAEGPAIDEEHIVIPGLKDVPFVPKTSDGLKELKKELRSQSVEDVERAFLLEALGRSGWNVTKAASEVGMQRTNFQGLMKRYGIFSRKHGAGQE